MSRILNKIYGEFPKVEVQLSKGAIELAKIDDLVKDRKDAAGMIVKIKNDLQDAISKMGSEISKLEKVESEAKKISAQLKELGIKDSKVEALADSNLAKGFKSSQSKVEAAIKSF